MPDQKKTGGAAGGVQAEDQGNTDQHVDWGNGGNGGGGNGAGSNGPNPDHQDNLWQSVQRKARQGRFDGMPAPLSKQDMHLVDNRLGQIHWWRDMPDVAGWLTGNSVPDVQRHVLAQKLPSVEQWVDQNTSLGGTPGALRHAYTKALEIKDPTMRLSAVTVLNNLRELNPQDQQMFMSLVKGTGKYGTEGIQATLGQVFGTDQGGSMGVQMTGDQGHGGPNFQLPGTANNDWVAAAEALFPSLRGRLQFNMDGGLTKQNIEDSFNATYPNTFKALPFVGAEFKGLIESNRALTLKAHYAVQGIDPSNDPMVAGRSWSSLVAATAAYDVGAVLMGTPAGAGLLAVAMGAHYGMEKIGQAEKEGTAPKTGIWGAVWDVGTAPVHIVDDLNNWVNDGMAAGGGFIANRLVDLGVSKDVAEPLGNLAMILVVNKAGEFMHGFSEETHITTPEAALGERSAAESVGRPSITEAVTKSLTDMYHHPAQVMHAYSYVTKPIADGLGRWVAERSGVADLVRGRSFTRLYEYASKLQDKGLSPERIASELLTHFGGSSRVHLSPDLALAVAKVKRELMPAAAADIIEKGIDGKALGDAGHAKEQIDIADQGVAAANDVQTRALGAETDLRPNGTGPQPLVTQDRNDPQVAVVRTSMPSESGTRYYESTVGGNVALVPDGSGIEGQPGASYFRVRAPEENLPETTYGPEGGPPAAAPMNPLDIPGAQIDYLGADGQWHPSMNHVETVNAEDLAASSDVDPVAMIARAKARQEAATPGYDSEGKIVTPEELKASAAHGKAILADSAKTGNKRPVVPVTDETIDQLHDLAGSEWAGANVDPRTGQIVELDSGYAGGVVPNDQTVKISIADAQDPAKFATAVKAAEKKFRRYLTRPNHYLGMFRDEEKGTVTLEPSIILHDASEAADVATYLKSDGGFYNLGNKPGEPEQNVFPNRLKPPTLEEQIKAEGVRQPIEVRVNEDGTLSVIDGAHRLKAARKLGAPLPVTYVDENGVPLRPTTSPLAVAQEGKIDEALAARHEAEAEAVDALKPVVPQVTLPTGRSLPEFLHRVFYPGDRALMTPTEKFFHAVFSPANDVKRWSDAMFGTKFNFDKQSWVTKLTDNMASGRPRLLDPNSATDAVTKRVIQDGNLTMLNRYLSRMEIPEAEKNVIIDHILNAKTSQDFYTATTQELWGQGGVIDRHLADNLPPEIRERILRRFDTDPLSYSGGVPQTGKDGVADYRPVAFYTKDGVPQKLPVLDNDFVGGVPLPNFDDTTMAVSRLRRITAGNRALSTFYNATKLFMDATRMGFKNPALFASSPWILLQKTSTEALSNWINPEATRVFGAEGAGVLGVVRRMFGGERPPGIDIYYENPNGSRVVPSAHDMTAKNMEGLTEGSTRQPVPVSSEKVLEDPTARSAGIRGIHGALERLRQSHLASVLIKNGFDVQKTIADMESGKDPVLAKNLHDLQPTLEKSGQTLEETLQRQVDEIKDVTFGGHPKYLRYVTHGVLHDGADAIAPEWGKMSHDYAAQSDKADMLREQLGRLNRSSNDRTTIEQIKSLQNQLRNALGRMNDMEAATGGTAESGTSWQDAGGVRKTISEDIKAGEIRPPKRILALQTMQSGYDEGAQGAIRHALQAWANLTGHMGFIGRGEEWGPRGGYFEQRTKQIETDLLQRGYKPEAAHAEALAQGVQDMTDLFYTLSTRSTAEKALKNVFWFAPVATQMAYQWMYAIPARYGYWLPGLFLTAAKVDATHQFLENSGLIHQTYNAIGEKKWTVNVPFSQFVLNHVFGTHLESDARAELTAPFHHVFSMIPTLSPAPALLLDNVIVPKIVKDMPFIGSLADTLAPFSDVSVYPSGVHSLLGVFGVKLPDATPSYVDSSFNKAHELSVAQAYAYLHSQGVDAPDPQDFNGDMQKFHTAMSNYYGQLFGLANKNTSANYFMRFIGGNLGFQYSDEEQQALMNFYHTKIDPNLAGGGPLTESLKTKLQNYLANHPGGYLYSVSTGTYTGIDATKYADVQDFSVRGRLNYLEGIKKTMDYEDWSKYALAQAMKSHYQGTLNSTIQNLAGSGSPAQQVNNLLTNWGTRSKAMTDYTNEFDQYLKLNPDMKAIYERSETDFRKAFGYGSQDLESQYLAQTMTGLNTLKDMGLFVDSNGTSAAEFTSVLGQIKAARAQLYRDSGGTLTPLEKGVDEYFKNVIEPYFADVQPLYDQLDAAKKAGSTDVEPIYQKIAAALASHSDYTYKGVKMPSPDAFLYYAKDKHSQALAAFHWASEPIAYLSPFQRQLVGWGSFTGEDQFWQAIQDQRTRTADAVTQYGYSSGSAQYDGVQKWEQREELNIANQYGPTAVQQLQYDNLAPAFRIQQTTPSVASNQTWQNVMQMVSYVNQQDAKTYTYGTKTSYMTQLKGWVYTAIQRGEQSDPQFRDIMQSASLTTKIDGETGAMGVPLYESLFFGNGNPSFIDTDLKNQYAPSGGIL